VVNQVGVLQGVGMGQCAAAYTAPLPPLERTRSAQFPLLFVVVANFVAVPAKCDRLSRGDRLSFAQFDGFLRKAGRLLLHELEAIELVQGGTRLPEEPNRADGKHGNE